MPGIVNEPPVLLADEPTGNLDTKTTHEIVKLLQRLNAEGMTILMVIQSHECAGGFAGRILQVSDGRLVNIDNKVSGKSANSPISIVKYPHKDQIRSYPKIVHSN